jgi:DNA-directed RNA polymerase specialized sigma24 family protein
MSDETESEISRIYRENFTFSVSIARKAGIPPQDAEDVAQRAWWTIVGLLRTSSIDTSGSIRQWIAAVVRNQCRNYRAKSTRDLRKHEALSNELGSGIAGSYPDCLRCVETQLVVEQVMRIASALPQGQQRAIHAQYIDQGSDGVPALQGKRNSSTYSRARRGLEALAYEVHRAPGPSRGPPGALASVEKPRRAPGAGASAPSAGRDKIPRNSRPRRGARVWSIIRSSSALMRGLRQVALSAALALVRRIC